MAPGGRRAQLGSRVTVFLDVGMGLHRTTTEPGSGRGSRRVTGALLLAALLSIAVALAPAGGEAKKRTKSKQARPNIVLIMDDDQSVNLQRFLTKTNASIASKGVTFDNSFVNYSLCCPSRSTMLTGQYAHNHRVLGNKPPVAATASSRRRSATPCRSGFSARATTRPTSASS